MLSYPGRKYGQNCTVAVVTADLYNKESQVKMTTETSDWVTAATKDTKKFITYVHVQDQVMKKFFFRKYNMISVNERNIFLSNRVCSMYNFVSYLVI